MHSNSTHMMFSDSRKSYTVGLHSSKDLLALRQDEEQEQAIFHIPLHWAE